MTAVFRVLLRMRVGADDGPAFERTWHRIAGRIAGETACLGQALMRDSTDPALYLVLSDWTDEAAFRAFEHGTAHTEHRAWLAAYRKEGSMTTTTVLAEVAPERVNRS
jgi:heme oxygenase (mycobilin-producing)